MVYDKKAQELSINTLITIILGIVIVGGGIAVIASFIGKANELPGQVDAQTQTALRNAIRNGEDKIVAIPQTVKTQRKKTALYGIGVVNQGASGTSFKISSVTLEVGPDTCSVLSAQQAPADCPQPNYLDSDFTIPNYETKTFYVGLDVPSTAPPGQYIYRVHIDQDSNVDYATKKIYLIVI